MEVNPKGSHAVHIVPGYRQKTLCGNYADMWHETVAIWMANCPECIRIKEKEDEE